MENALLLSESVRSRTVPVILCEEEDVEGSHGATVGQLNVDELFYMRSRGIPEAEARTLQMLSFLSPVIPQGREQEVETAVRSL